LLRPVYRPDIDGLRGIAVLAVVAFHASAAHVPGGFAGVDVFFVISGYLISSILLESLAHDSLSFSEFYARRIRRIVPALIFVLAVVWAIGWFTLLADEYEQLGNHIAASGAFVINIVLWNQAGYFDTAAASKPLLHLWSLGVEEQFYLIWPMVLALCWRRRMNAFVAVLSIGVASFVANVATVRYYPTAAFYLPHTRLWELLVGAALACVTLARTRPSGLALPGPFARVLTEPRPATRDALACAAVALLAVSFFVLGGDRAFPGWRALMPVAGAAALIASGPDAWINRRVLSHRALVWVGLISYPLYLWHWPALTFPRILAVGEPAPLVKSAAIVLSFLLAWLTYWFFERPIRTAPRRTATSALLGSLAVVAVAGFAVRVWSRDLPPRFPARVQRLVDFGYRYEDLYRERRCYLMAEQIKSELAADCVDAGPTAAPLVVLWGDSHAAHLYPGLRHLQQAESIRVAQFTGARCPPLLGLESEEQPNCRALNDDIIERIRVLKPATVLLAAEWRLYDPRYFERTLGALQQQNVPKVIVVGPVPIWEDRLPRVLFNQVRRDPLHGVPARLRTGIVDQPRGLEEMMRAKAARFGTDYVSAIDILCTADGCLTMANDQPDGLTAWDQAHLTQAGSIVLVGGLKGRLLPSSSRRLIVERRN